MTRISSSMACFLAGAALLVTGCPADTVPADTGETTGDGDGDTGDGDGDTGDGDGDTGDGDGDTGSTCGDGVVDAGEECDDGNTDDGDGCSSTCTVSACGLAWSTEMPVDSGVNGGFDVAVGDDGSVYAVGIKVNADNDGWVAKWGPDGALAWEQSFDSGNGNDALAGIALGDGGEIYVAGWMEGANDDALWYAALDSSGAETWSMTVESGGMGFAGADDLASDIAVATDGDLIVLGRVGVADGDDDVWIRKASAADGSEVWTSTWGGTGDGMFSTDRAGQIAVGEGGTTWVSAREHYDFNSQEAVVLELDADGNHVSTIQPQANGDHQHDPIDLAWQDGALYFAMEDADFPYRGWLYKLDPSGAEQWVLTEADWVVVGEDWIVRGIGVDGAGHIGVAGVFGNEEAGEGITWGEAWVAKLDAEGNFVCRSSHMVTDEAFLPPSLEVDGAGFSAGGFGMTGIVTPDQGNDLKLWTGFFMP